MNHTHQTAVTRVRGYRLRRARPLLLLLAGIALGGAGARWTPWLIQSKEHSPSDRATNAAPPPGGTSGLSHACRFWGLVGSGYPTRIIEQQLRTGTVANLKDLGGANHDGWGFGLFLSGPERLLLNHPLIRRGGPPANSPSDPDYDMAVAELERLLPRAAIGHVRAGSSGHWGIPNPHPFEHDGYIFAHNGTLSEDALVGMLTDDDAGYLQQHPPDYVNGYIDSELYLLYIMKYVRTHPSLDRTEAIRRAARQVSSLQSWCRINFVMTRGDTLLALRCAPSDAWDPVCYYPSTVQAPTPASPYWIVASQVLGSRDDGWAEIPKRTLAVFVPGHAPEFHALDADAGEPEDPDRTGTDIEQPAEPDVSGATELPAIGNAMPNPSRESIRIPLRVPAGGGRASLEIWDVNGRLVRSGIGGDLAGGDGALLWDGLDHEGVRAATGTYFCRVRLGAQVREQRILLVR
jgi:predicted glutamine amidotransferase